MPSYTARTGVAFASDPSGALRHPIKFVRQLRVGEEGRLPGPEGRRVIGVLPEWRRDPFNYLRDCGEKYGDVYRVPLPVWDMIVVSRPDHVAHIMNDRTGRYSMIGPFESIARAVGASIPMMEGDPFRVRRRMIMPMFGRSSLVEIAVPIVDEFTQRLDTWQEYAASGKEIDLQHEIATLTMPAFMRAMFSITPSADEIAMLDNDLRSFMRTIASVLFLCRPSNPFPLPGVDSLPRSLWRTRRWINTQIEHRLANPVEKPDLLQVLMDARYEDGTPISRRDLIMELTVLIAGGYETVVASLSWTLALLAENPDAQQRLYDEVDALQGRAPAYDDLGHLEWAKACFDEGQRLQGHPFHPRFALQDDEIDGFFIPRGSMVGVSMYALHRDPRWWTDPDSFDPNRFYDNDIVKARPNLAFIPFGAGPHRCVGAALAYMNAQFLLALIHQRFRIHTRPDWHPRHASTFSVTIEGGLPVTLSIAPHLSAAPTSDKELSA